MRRSLAVLGLTAALLAPGAAWAQETPEPRPTNVDVVSSPAPSPTTSPTPVPATCSPMPGFDCSGRRTASPSPTASCGYVVFSVDRNPIRSGEVVTVTATRMFAGEAGLTARLTRRVPAPAAVVRSDTSTASVVTWPLRLGESHVFLAESVVQDPDQCVPLGRPSGFPLQVDVQPTLSLAATRNAPRDYAFTGRVRPAKAQGVTLYRHEGARRIITSQSVVAPDGTYRFDRRFTGSGRFGFSVAVKASSAHLAGSSAVRPTVIH